MRKLSQKVKPPEGCYVSSLEDGQLIKLQKQRSLWLLFAHVAFVFGIFIKQDCMNRVVQLLPLETVYFILMFAAIVIFVWAGVFNFRRGKIDRTIPEKAVPKRGLDGVLTFPVFEAHFLIAATLAVLQVVLISLWFDWGGLVVTLLSVCTAAATFMVRTVSVRAFRGNLTYRPPYKTEIPQVSEAVEDFYAGDEERQDAPEASEEFYDEKDISQIPSNDKNADAVAATQEKDGDA